MNLNFLVDLLVSAGATLNAYNFESHSALASAVRSNDWKNVVDFIGLGANAEKSCDHVGTTALMIAVQEEKIAAVQLISELGANLNHKNKMGDAALHQAAMEAGRSSNFLSRRVHT
jgi:ankyrin repeat protein